MWRRIRCRESLGLPITKANIKHAALLRAAILHEIKTGHFEYGRHFPNSKHATNYSSAKDERLGGIAGAVQAVEGCRHHADDRGEVRLCLGHLHCLGWN
ncbi:Arm DNA-binding domain-containing protein [Pseudomonas paracarnis]|uniref:Arm DNA-binding domain-containing protein n=1 Tax=Pseudomonas paracarnis TaxID=2750625 RepID=UPI002650D5B2|nr:DUF3596 domain-containing protein [Pseudomonadales bacterium]MDN5429667.1 DUF3596 domain-containing protein [Pseudomonadales bacterium]